MNILETVKLIFKHYGIIDINTKMVMNLKGGYSDLGEATLHSICVIEVMDDGFAAKIRIGEDDGYLNLDYSKLKQEEFTIARDDVIVKMYKDKTTNRSCLSILHQGVMMMNCYMSNGCLVKDNTINSSESNELFKAVMNFK